MPAALSRDLEIPSRLRDSLALMVQGVRRCGKSTLLTQIVKSSGAVVAIPGIAHSSIERGIRERVGARSSTPIKQVVQMAFGL